jgi:hypothetical protein
MIVPHVRNWLVDVQLLSSPRSALSVHTGGRFDTEAVLARDTHRVPIQTEMFQSRMDITP